MQLAMRAVVLLATPSAPKMHANVQERKDAAAQSLRVLNAMIAARANAGN